ncbi:hypothetical protein G3I44_13235 [Halogeometricum borinquense]|uniref:Uncharacterized protein n=1 Tax=Halogeometricum borinquense TaxID=60847 RepID=A0A6C0UIY3_9EURY|nr:hypothetical protein [Halogeometricum borinquense]QIB75160.1 hypothetical protein G3I44_13235 [Halogeometricum borinquense]
MTQRRTRSRTRTSRSDEGNRTRAGFSLERDGANATRETLTRRTTHGADGGGRHG